MNIQYFHKFYLYLITIFIFTNCNFQNSKNKNASDQSSLIKISIPKEASDTLKASYFSDSVEYIRFQTPKGIYVNSLLQHKIVLDDTSILINNDKNLLLFKRNGEFIREIGKYGRGPGEHLNILGFERIKNKIYVSSTGKQNILKYHINGQFLNEIKAKQFTYMCQTSDSLLCIYDRIKGCLLFMNDKEEFLDTLIVEHNVGNRHTTEVADPRMIYLYKDNNNLYFTNYLSDTIWKINPNKKEIAFISNLKSELLPQKYNITYYANNLNDWNRIVKEYKKVHLSPIDQKIFIYKNNWQSGHLSSISIFNRKTNQITKYNTQAFLDDIVGMQWVVPVVNNQSLIIGVTTPYMLSTYNKENYYKKPTNIWLKQMKDISENDNQILVIFKLKKV